MGIRYCVMLILWQNNIGELQLYLYILLHVQSDIAFSLLEYHTCLCLQFTAELASWFLDRISICTHQWHQNDLLVFKLLFNLTELNLFTGNQVSFWPKLEHNGKWLRRGLHYTVVEVTLDLLKKVLKPIKLNW